MKTLINCPVCGYKEVNKDQCPNCDTKVTLLQQLVSLSELSESSLNSKVKTGPLLSFNKWRYIIVTLAILLLSGIGIVFTQQLFKSGSTKNTDGSPILLDQKNLPVTIGTLPTTMQDQGFTYTIVSGDTLSTIAQKFYHDSQLYKKILENNPHLRKRIDSIEVGETILIKN